MATQRLLVSNNSMFKRLTQNCKSNLPTSSKVIQSCMIFQIKVLKYKAMLSSLMLASKLNISFILLSHYSSSSLTSFYRYYFTQEIEPNIILQYYKCLIKNQSNCLLHIQKDIKEFINRLYNDLKNTREGEISTNSLLVLYIVSYQQKLHDSKSFDELVEYLMSNHYLTNIIMYKTWGNERVIDITTKLIKLLFSKQINFNPQVKVNIQEEYSILESLCENECIEPKIQECIRLSVAQ